MSEVQAINNQIVFKFVEDTTKGQFNSKTAGGILLVEHGHNQVENARWATVVAVGPDAEGLDEGEIVLIENLRWTSEFIVSGESYWVSDDKSILAKWDDSENLPKEVA